MYVTNSERNFFTQGTGGAGVGCFLVQGGLFWLVLCISIENVIFS